MAGALLLSGVALAQPEYLLVLLRNINQAEGEAFDQTVYSLHDRLYAGLYTDEDKLYLMSALVSRLDHDPERATTILTLLGQLELPQCVPILGSYARSQDEAIRLHAVQALGWIGDGRALPLLDSLRANTPTTSPAYPLIEYARDATNLKVRYRAASEDEQVTLLRHVVVEGESAFLRADMIRLLRNRPGTATWEIMFDAYAAHSQLPGWRDRITQLISARYTFQDSGYVAFLRTRPTDQRFLGLRAIEEIAVTGDMTALMNMSQTDPDQLVAEVANRIVFRMLTR